MGSARGIESPPESTGLSLPVLASTGDVGGGLSELPGPSSRQSLDHRKPKAFGGPRSPPVRNRRMLR